MEEKLIEEVDKRIQSLEKDKEQIEQELNEISTREQYTRIKSPEHLELESDLPKVNAELETVNKEKNRILKLITEKNEKMEMAKKYESLLKDKEQLENAINELASKRSFQDGKFVKTAEQLEYESDLERVNQELSEVDKLNKRISRINQELNGFARNYNIKLDDENREQSDIPSETSLTENTPIDEFSLESLSDEELQEEYQNLLEEYRFRAHEENGMEQHEDDDTLERMDRIKKEIDRRKAKEQNPYENLSDEELEEEYQNLLEEYRFRAHQENGMEQHEDDDILERIQKIQEELKRRNKVKDFQPPVISDKDFQPPAIRNNDFQPPAIIPDKDKEIPDNDKDKKKTDDDKDKEKSLISLNSGLQQFRKQMNLIKDNYPIQNRHTLTERLPLPRALAGVAGAGLLAINPIAGVGVLAASAVSGPILYRLTGQKKLEDKIADQLRQMSEKDFELMVDFLSEETIQTIKPNAVFLRALHKVMLENTKDQNAILTERDAQLRREASELLSRNTELTPEENDRLKRINDEIEKINKEDAPNVQRRLKEIKRGKDRVSQRYKGNLATRFNIFAHRNTNSKEYDEPINKLADAELLELTGKANNDQNLRTQGMQEMRDVLIRYTSRNFLGIQNSIFNFNSSPVRIISDKVDQTTKRIAIIGTALIGGLITGRMIKEMEQAQQFNKGEMEKLVNSANAQAQSVNNARGTITQASQEADYIVRTGGVSKDVIQKAADAQVTKVATAGETAVLHKEAGFTSDYFKGDELTQDAVDYMAKNSTVNLSDQPSMLRQLANIAHRGGQIGAKRLQNVAENMSKTHFGPNGTIDHTTQIGYEAKALEQAEAEAQIFEKTASTFEGVTKIDQLLKNIHLPQMQTFANTFKEVKASYIGPIVAGLASAFGLAKDASKNVEEEKHNRGANIDQGR